MLRSRIFTGIVGAIFGIAIAIIGGWWLALVAFIFAEMALWEYKRMLHKVDIYTSFTMMTVVVGVLLLCAQIGNHLFILAILAAMLPVMFWVAIFMRRANDFKSLFFTVGGALYIGFGFASVLLLRRGDFLIESAPDLYMNASNEAIGIFFIFFVLLGTWFSDIGAFFVGRRFGKHSLAKKISPNKTWEGFIGGGISTMVVLSIYSYLYGLSLYYAIVWALLVAVAAPAGDLFESMMKRFAGIKDSGNILPGHGGILDRFDSLLFAAPLLLSGIFLMAGVI